MEFDTTIKTTKEFPFYQTNYEEGYVKGCVKNDKFKCDKCVCKTFCKCKED